MQQQGRVSSIPTVASLLAAFFAISLTAGVLGAGLAMPAVASFGTVTKSAVGLYDSLPTEFTAVVPGQQSELLASDGKTVIATLYAENRIVVPLKQIAPVMRKAQVAIEDKRFYQHGGVDLEGMGAVVAGVAAGKDARGASTLTQQYVKVTLMTAAHNRGDYAAEKAAQAATPARKLQEMKYAVEVEKLKSKDEILQDYLNLVYFGDQAYGVEAAARHFFSTTAAKLTLAQAATLAGQVQNPGTVNAVINPEGTLKRRNTVLYAMRQQGLITQKDYDTARKQPLGVKVKNQPNSCVASRYPFLCEYAVGWLKQQPVLGDSEKARLGNVLSGGYRIVTTFDLSLQDKVQKIVNDHVPATDYKPVGATAVTLDPNTGKVKAAVNSTGFSIKAGEEGKQGVNWAVDYKYGANNGLAIGSTMKLFTLVEALKQGYGLNGVVNDIPKAPAIFTGRDLWRDDCAGASRWEVSNAEGEGDSSSMSLRDITAHSVNTAFAKLSLDLGACKVRQTATDMGFHQATGQPIKKSISDIALGSGGHSMQNLAQAYGVVAAKGKLCPETVIESMTDSKGKRVDLKLPPCKQAIPEGVANATADILKSVIAEGTGKGLGIGRPAAGKTGTNEFDASTFAGITPQLSTAVWVGNPDQHGHFKNVRINGRFYHEVFGATVAGPIWRDIMRTASRGMPVVDFGQNMSEGSSRFSSSSGSSSGTTSSQYRGESPRSTERDLEAQGFTVVRRYVYSSSVPRGQVVSTRTNGKTVTIRVSNGPRSGSSNNTNGNDSSTSTRTGTNDSTAAR